VAAVAAAVTIGAVATADRALPAQGSNTTTSTNKPVYNTDKFIGSVMASSPTRGWSSVIVRHAAGKEADARRQVAALGGYVYRDLNLIDGFAARVPSKGLLQLAGAPGVTRLSADAPVQKADVFTTEHTGADVARVSSGLTGRGVGVAVIDSGIRATSDFSSIVARVNFAPDGQVNDTCGHGTHVAGIVAGNGLASSDPSCFVTYRGTAPDASLISIRVLNGDGQGTVSQAIRGIEWAVQNRAKYNIRVMNLSFGHEVGESYTTDPLCQAVEQAWKSGIVVVCAAGNNGRVSDDRVQGLDNEGFGTNHFSIQSPANSPYVITVGAAKSVDGNRANDRIATYSSRGPSRLDFVLKPDIVAPGNRVVSVNANNSTLDNAYGGSNQVSWKEYRRNNAAGASSRYFRLSGTSMAAPVVSGAAALLIQQDPSLTPDTVKARLMLSADRWVRPDGTPDAYAYGAGYLNLPAALASSYVPDLPALSPSLVLTEDGRILVRTQTGLYGAEEIQGLAAWSRRNDWSFQAIWGTQAIWGFAAPRGGGWNFQAIWGTDTARADLSRSAIQGED
jgi:serine protease AprX